MTDVHSRRPLRTLQVGVLARTRVGAMYREKSVARAMARLAVDLQVGNVKVEAKSEAEIHGTPLWRQGDDHLSTEASMTARKKLRHESHVVGVLHEWWTLVQKTGSVATCNGEEALTQEGYRLIFLRIYRVLLEEWDSADAASCVAEDWEQDCSSRGASGLSQHLFFDSMFEVGVLCQTADL